MASKTEGGVAIAEEEEEDDFKLHEACFFILSLNSFSSFKIISKQI